MPTRDEPIGCIVRLMRVLSRSRSLESLAASLLIALCVTGCTTTERDSTKPLQRPTATTAPVNDLGVVTGFVPTCYGPGPDTNLRKVNVVEVRQQGHLLQSVRVPTDNAHHEYRLSVRSGEYRLKLSDVPRELAVSVSAGQTVRADFPAMTCL